VAEASVHRPLVAILAGGAGSRMGKPKAMVELAGRPLIAYPLAAAREAGLDVAVVAKRDSPLPALECRIFDEPDEPRHPLTGILAALDAAADRPILALACDMPFVTAELLAWLASREPPSVPRVDGRLEPLLALYGPHAAAALRGALAEELPLREAIAALAPTEIGGDELARFGDPGRLAFSVNTPDDLAEAERILGGEP
jgi:molybdopterin-guanine dinucleotide biosynthesis protein A